MSPLRNEVIASGCWNRTGSPCRTKVRCVGSVRCVVDAVIAASRCPRCSCRVVASSGCVADRHGVPRPIERGRVACRERHLRRRAWAMVPVCQPHLRTRLSRCGGGLGSRSRCEEPKTLTGPSVVHGERGKHHLSTPVGERSYYSGKRYMSV